MQRRAKVAAALAGAGAAMLLTPAGPALSGVVRSLVDAPEAVSAGPPDEAPAIAELTAAEREEAVALLSTDPAARRFLRGRAFSVAEIGPWTTEDGAKIGASLVVELAQPASFPLARWPVATFERGRSNGKPFREDSIPLEARNVTQLRVLVDGGRGVVGIEPDGLGATITPGPGIERVEPDEPGY